MSRPPRRLESYAAYLFDVDGTLTYHDHAVPGAPEALLALKAHGKRIVAVTNNSSLSRHQLAERFRRFGLPIEDDEVFSAMVATAECTAIPTSTQMNVQTIITTSLISCPSSRVGVVA